MSKKLHFVSKDFTVREISDWESKGRLETNPDYQRDFIYPLDKRSRLIESALMNIPLPTIYLCEEDNGHFSVIDGQQRIMSFISFLRNEYSLRSLTQFKELNGKKYKELSDEDQSTVETTSFRTIIIEKDSADSKYDIFERLNRGALTLKEQELRNCVYRGSYNNMINALAKNEQVNKMFISDNKRMAYQELILRFFALRNFTNFQGSLKKFLNDYMGTHQHDEDSKVDKGKKIFNSTLSIVSEVLGPKAFWLYDKDSGEIKKQFSPTYYDSIMVAFQMFDKNKIMQKADKIRDAINDIKTNNYKYKMACYTATGDKGNVITRITTIFNALADVLNNDGMTKEKRAFDPTLKPLLYKRQNGLCPLCGNKIVDTEKCMIDHIIPYSKGGSTDINNAQLVHGLCNLEKGNHVEIESILGKPETYGKRSLNCIDFNYTGSKPQQLVHNGLTYDLEGKMRSLLQTVVDILVSYDPPKMIEFAKQGYKPSNNSKIHINDTKEGLINIYSPYRNIYVETNMNANAEIKFLHALITDFGLNPDDFVVYYGI